jgi:DNA-binding GntR family transcriptional regulator
MAAGTKPRLGERAIRRLPLHDATLNVLRGMILSCDLTPGSKISEPQLCEELMISRTPLREALKVLTAEGLVELRPHRGAVVTRIDPAEIASIFQVMEVLERLAGELACRHATASDLAALEVRHARLLLLHRQGKRAEYFQVNREIHTHILALTGNPTLETIYASCASKITRARALANYDAARWLQSVDEHETIMEALRAGKADLTAERLAEHSHRTGEAVIAALQRLDAAG